jgi:ssDNA-binding Zn-finger/Zn-ribbon topoisomerase 1
LTDLSLRIWIAHDFCSKCGDILVKREPRNGKHFEPFYSCRSWPDCNFTRAILPDGSIEPEIYLLDDLSWIMEEPG